MHRKKCLKRLGSFNIRLIEVQRILSSYSSFLRPDDHSSNNSDDSDVFIPDDEGTLENPSLVLSAHSGLHKLNIVQRARILL